MDNTTKLFQLTEDIISELRKYRELWTIKELQKGMYKRTPKKVLYEDVGYDYNKNENVYACICPTCDLHIITFTDSDIECDSDEPKEMFHSSLVYHAYEGRNNYCDRCGQKLDWS